MASRKHESPKRGTLDGSLAMTFTSDFTVRFGEVDRAQVMYYPRFFHLFHQTFEEWFGGALGVPYPEVLNNENLGFPTVKVETEFLKPLRFGDRVRIVLELVAIGEGSLTLSYTAVRLADGEVAARATVKKATIENDTFRPVTIDDVWRQRFERFQRGDQR
jgi:4-hydroxybenzoyl-CoA thioesterase